MENSELWQAYIQAEAKTNVFDRILSLKKFEKIYKKSSFYKQTKMSIKELQQYLIMFRMNDILDNVVTYASVEGIGQFFEEILDSMDEAKIQGFFGRIADNFDPNTLGASMNTLQEQINQLRK